MKTFRTMLKTEIKLSVRGMDMVIFGLCLPVAMVVILGAVSGNRPAFEGASYTFFEQSFGALSTIAICAGGVMGLPLLISDYRQKKILKRFQVTPVSPALILAVHVAIYAIYALGSLVLVYGTSAVFFGFRPGTADGPGMVTCPDPGGGLHPMLRHCAAVLPVGVGQDPSSPSHEIHKA